MAVLAGHSDGPPTSVERAREAVRVADDRLAAARAVEAEIEARAWAVGQAIPMARSDVEHAARATL